MAISERLQILIEATGAGAVVRDFNQISAASTKLGGTTAATGGRFEKLASGLGVSADTLKTGLVTGATVAGAALVAFGHHAVGAYQDGAQAALKFSRASGASMEDSSRIIAAFDDMGVSAETGAKAIFGLGRRVADGGANLAKFGVEVARSKDGTTDLAGTLLNVSEAYTRTADPARRAALLTAAFGKQGQDLIPVLEQGRRGIQRLFDEAEATGQVFDDEDRERSEQLRLSIDGLGDAFGELALKAGEALAPLATDLVESATEILGLVDKIVNTDVSGTGLVDILRLLNPLAGGFNKVEIAAGDAKTGIGRLTDEQSKRLKEAGRAGLLTADAYDEILNGQQESLAEFAAEAKGSTEEQAESLTKLEGALLSAAAADRALVDANRGLAAANATVADAQGDLNRLLREGAVDTEKVADAQRSLAAAQRSVGAARRDQARAQAEYDAALTAAGVLGLDSAQDRLADAKDNLADANDRVADAQDRAKDAAETLSKAQAGDPAFQDKLATARQRVTDATDGLRVSQLTLAEKTWEANKAHDAQKESLALSADAAGRLEEKLRALIALQPALTPLLSGPLAAVNAVNTASAPGPSPLDRFTGTGLLGGGALSGLPAPAGTTTNNTINVQVPGQAADPVLLAREIVWSLN